MSTFVFKCPRCQAEVEADEDWRGLESPCPQCGETIAIPAKVSLKLAAPSPGKEKEQHLEFARLAMQTGVYGEAEEEFDCVLAEDPENIDALYGKMLCLARMSTDSDPKWRSMVFTCTKIERIISDASGDLKAFRLRFIGEFIPIICSAYDREFSAFNELKVKADFREGIQLLAAARGPSWLLLSPSLSATPEKDQARAQLPHIKEILFFMLFMVRIINDDIGVEEIAQDTAQLLAVQGLCERILRLDDVTSAAGLLAQVQKRLREFDEQAKAEIVRETAAKLGVSEADAASYLVRLKKLQEKSGSLRNRLYKYTEYAAVALILGFLALTLEILFLRSAKSGAAERVGFLLGVVVCVLAALWIRRAMKKITDEIAECASLGIAVDKPPKEEMMGRGMIICLFGFGVLGGIILFVFTNVVLGVAFGILITVFAFWGIFIKKLGLKVEGE